MTITFKRALEKIRDEQGHVCTIFELCKHEACRSSYTSWAIADKALRDAENRTVSRGAPPTT